jgi:hypothetical protein
MTYGTPVVPNDVRRHRLISISYMLLLPCHGRGREFESRRPRHFFRSLQRENGTFHRFWVVACVVTHRFDPSRERIERFSFLFASIRTCE